MFGHRLALRQNVFVLTFMPKASQGLGSWRLGLAAHFSSCEEAAVDVDAHSLLPCCTVASVMVLRCDFLQTYVMYNFLHKTINHYCIF